MQQKRTILRVNLVRAHGSPTRYLYDKGCRCIACRAARAAYDASYRAAYGEKRAAYDAAYRAAHREKIASYFAAYRAAHREETAACRAAYNAGHREERLAYDAAYYTEHREEAAAYRHTRRSRERGNGGTHTAADVRAQYKRQRGRCYYCGVEVGDTYHVDHVVPISKGGSNDPSNLVVACAPCNLRKNDKLPHEFAGRLC